MAPRLLSHDNSDDRPLHRSAPHHGAPLSPEPGYGSGLQSDPTWVDNPGIDSLRIGCCIGTSAMGTESGAMEDGGDGDIGAVGNDVVSPWMEWVESGIEFFGCDENAPRGQRRSVFGRAMMLHHAVKAAVQEDLLFQVEETPKDYAAMHDAFLEALLYEQIKLADSNGVKKGIILSKGSVDSSISNVSSSSSFDDGVVSTSAAGSKRSNKLSKRKRAVKPPRHPKPVAGNKVAPVTPTAAQDSEPIREFTMPLSPSSTHSADSVSATSPSYSSHSARDDGTGSGKAEKVSLQQIADGQHLPPESWIHPEMQLQKDKGKGEPIGSAICAKGEHACLEKLRQKIELVVQVAMGEDKSKKSAKIKRRLAKVTEETDNYTETRSLIELRLGFLSMQYGMLIRWDKPETHKAILFVMRKTCHESFYDKTIPRPTTPVPKRSNSSLPTAASAQPARRRLEPPPLVVRDGDGDHAVFQRPLGTEVLLVNPPYRIEPPTKFPPAVLTVDINYATGLSKSSNWNLSLTFADQTQLAQLHWNADTEQFETRRLAKMQWELKLPISSFELSGLEIRLYEQPCGRKDTRHTASMTMPLGGLVAQPSTAEATSWRVTIPCSHDEKNASITLSFIHLSEYAYWLYKELDARRRHEVDVGSNGAPIADPVVRAQRQIVVPRQAPTLDEDDDDLWDWLCGMCQH